MKNREIKFRAWDKQHNCFTQYPFVVDNKGNVFKEYIGGGKLEKHYVLMQFTGLTDKNGKEIYESDLVLYKEEKRIVSWAGLGWELQQKDSPAHAWDLWEPEFSELIGNIYENPQG